MPHEHDRQGAYVPPPATGRFSRRGRHPASCILHALSVCAPPNEAYVARNRVFIGLFFSLFCNRTSLRTRKASSTCYQCVRRIIAGLGTSSSQDKTSFPPFRYRASRETRTAYCMRCRCARHTRCWPATATRSSSRPAARSVARPPARCDTSNSFLPPWSDCTSWSADARRSEARQGVCQVRHSAELSACAGVQGTQGSF